MTETGLEDITFTFKSHTPYSQFSSLTKSPSLPGTSTFISELLALTISHDREPWLRYTWQPSVLLMEMVGTLPITCMHRKLLATNRRGTVCWTKFPRGSSRTHKHTHLDFNILAVDHLNNSHNVIKHKAQFLAVICRDSEVKAKRTWPFFGSTKPPCKAVRGSYRWWWNWFFPLLAECCCCTWRHKPPVWALCHWSQGPELPPGFPVNYNTRTPGRVKTESCMHT